MQIGRTILPPSVKTANFLCEILREDTSTYILCFPLEQSLARTTDSGRVVGKPEVSRGAPCLRDGLRLLGGFGYSPKS